MTDKTSAAETINAAVSSWLAGTQMAGWYDGLPGDKIIADLDAAGLKILPRDQALNSDSQEAGRDAEGYRKVWDQAP